MKAPDLDFLQKPKKPRVQDFTGHFDPIIPFDQNRAPGLSVDLLPPILGDFVQNIADVLLVPVAMPFMASLGMVSACVAKKFVVSPKPDWLEPVNVYSFTAMPPASNKSQTLKLLRGPIDEWEQREAKRIGPERDKVVIELKLLQNEISKQYNVLKSRKSTSDAMAAAKKAVAELEEELKAKQEALPVLPQVYTSDATPEAIAQLVHEQNGRLAVISDEGGITEVLAGLYSDGNANIDIFLKGIDGGAARIKRANRDYKLNPYLTVILLVQPQVLSNMADKRAFDGNGTLERYLYTVPESNVGYREFTDARIDTFVQERYGHLVMNLLSIPAPENPYVLQLENPAKASFREFRKAIERELRADGKLHLCVGWGGKLAGYTLRLAGLMHLAEHADVRNLVIQKGTMDKAVTLAKLLMEHAVTAYSMMGTDIVEKDAKEVLEWIKTQKTEEIVKSKIINAMRNRKVGKKDRLGKALSLLVERHYLAGPYLDDATRKPSEVYFVNPEM